MAGDNISFSVQRPNGYLSVPYEILISQSWNDSLMPESYSGGLVIYLVV